MNFNLVEMYNGLLRFNKHILNELAEGLKHLPNLDGVSKGDSLIINEQGNPAWGSAAFIPTFENAAYGIEWTKDDNDIIRIGNANNQAALNTNLTSDGFKQGGLGAGVTNLTWDRWTAFNGNNPIVQTYWTAEHNIGNGSTNGDHYELGNYNADGSNFDTYPAVYRGILNFFGDIWTFIRDVVIINRNANYNSVYLLKKGVNHSDVTKDNVNEKCYFIGDQANTNNFITEFDFRFGPYFVPNKVGTNKKSDYNWKRGDDGQDTDKAIRVLRLGGSAHNGSEAGSGGFHSHWVRSVSNAYVGFFTTVKLD